MNISCYLFFVKVANAISFGGEMKKKYVKRTLMSEEGLVLRTLSLAIPYLTVFAYDYLT